MHVPPELSRIDRIARQAAILLETGEVSEMHRAIRIAADTLGLADGPMPGHGTVRKHAQAMAMQAMGEAGYQASRQQILGIAEELMTVLDQAGWSPLLMGRAAAGHVDGGVTLHIRLTTDDSLAELARLIVEYGYEEPAFDTVHSMYGPMNRLRLSELGVPIVLTRCPKALQVTREVDLFTGKAIASATLEELQRQFDAG